MAVGEGVGAAAGTVTSANSASSLHLLRRPRPASAYSVDTSPIYLSPQRDTRHKPSAQIAAHAHLYRNNKLPFDSSVTMQETATLPAGPLQTPVSRFIKRARFDLQISLLQAPIDKQHTDSHLAEDIVRADLQTLPQFELGLQAGSLDLSHSRRSSNDSHSTASSDTLVSKPLEHKVVLAFTYGCHRDQLVQLLSPLAIAGADIGLVSSPSTSRMIKSVSKALQLLNPMTRIFKIGDEPTSADIASCLMHAEHEFESEDIDIVINVIGGAIPPSIKRMSSVPLIPRDVPSLSSAFSHSLESAMVSTNAVLPSLPSFSDAPASRYKQPMKKRGVSDGGRVINIYGDSSQFASDTRAAMVSFASNVHRILWRQRGVKVFGIHPECRTCSILSLATGSADNLAGRYLDKQVLCRVPVIDSKRISMASISGPPVIEDVRPKMRKRFSSAYNLFSFISSEREREGTNAEITDSKRRPSLRRRSGFEATQVQEIVKPPKALPSSTKTTIVRSTPTVVVQEVVGSATTATVLSLPDPSNSDASHQRWRSIRRKISIKARPAAAVIA